MSRSLASLATPIAAFLVFHSVAKLAAVAAPFGTDASISYYSDDQESNVGEFQYNEGQASTSLSSSNEYFSGAAESMLGGNGISPTLRVKAEQFVGPDNGSVFVTAAATERYTFVGTSPATIDYTFVLTGSVVTPLGEEVQPSYISADIGFYLAPGLDEYVNDFGYYDFIGYFSSLGITLTYLGSDFAYLEGNESNGMVSGTITLDLEPGDEVFLNAELIASIAAPGAVADAFSTFTGTFSDPTQLVPAGGVPEPSAMVLFSVGCSFLGWNLRRSRCR